MKKLTRSLIYQMVLGVLVVLATICFVVASGVSGDSYYHFLVSGIAITAVCAIFIAIELLEE